MTEADDAALRPARRRDRTDAGDDTDDSDALDRGRTVALLAALGRMQMSLDVISKQQQQRLDAIEARLSRIERALGDRS
jgi:hypothetical protein